MSKKKKIIFIICIAVILIFLACVIILFAQRQMQKKNEAKLEAQYAEELQSAYEAKLESLKTGIESGWSEQLPYEISLSDNFEDVSDPEDVLYCIQDLDQDGTEELYIGKMEEDHFLIYNIFSSEEKGKAFCLYKASRNEGFYCVNDLYFMEKQIVNDTISPAEEEEAYTIEWTQEMLDQLLFLDDSGNYVSGDAQVIEHTEETEEPEDASGDAAATTFTLTSSLLEVAREPEEITITDFSDLHQLSD